MGIDAYLDWQTRFMKNLCIQNREEIPWFEIRSKLIFDFLIDQDDAGTTHMTVRDS
jgi:hypothetical protein